MELVLLLTTLIVCQAKDWAVIVAGSKSYGNYRHQSDACHAYHITKDFGIPDERIIMFFYDDIAHSSSNPFPGKIFNKPTEKGTPGIDVYAGCKKDYTGSQVTPSNFVKVLTGDSSAPGSVLQSTSEDNVFVNFVDHGGTGIIAFPSGTMSATMLNSALKKMHSKNMYKKLVFYMEACEAGSMFENLIPTDMNIYVTTASNAKESSWGTYCPPDDMVNGVHLKSCLGDLYSVNWMQNADQVGKQETLAEQFTIIKKDTTKSHVMQYGDLDFTSDPIGDFMGDKTNLSMSRKSLDSEIPTDSGAVASRDIPIHLAYYNYILEDGDIASRQKRAEELINQIRIRQEADALFYHLATAVDSEKSFFRTRSLPINFSCTDTVHAAVEELCGGYNDYSLQYSRVVVNLCEVANSEEIIKELMKLC